jgi:hypothetical protein
MCFRMPPKIGGRKLAGRSNQKQGLHTIAVRSEATKRGLAVASGRLDFSAVRRGWAVLRSAFRFALILAKVQRQRGDDMLICSITNVDGKFPSVYKAKQFGASHHAFNSADQRRLARAQTDLDLCKSETKMLRSEVRSLESEVRSLESGNEDLKHKLSCARQVQQNKSQAATLEKEREYKKLWIREKRRHRLINDVMPQLRRAAASMTLTEEQRLQLVVDHIQQVHSILCTLS